MNRIDYTVIIGFSIIAFHSCTMLANAVEVGVLGFGATKHHSTKFAPNGGYNENNHVIGVEILQDNDGVAFGGSVARLDDSFNKPSFWAMATVEYKRTYDDFSVSGGVGLGYLETSYYNGLFGTPFGKVRHNDTGLYCKVMIQPISNDHVDSFTAVTGGISKKF